MNLERTEDPISYPEALARADGDNWRNAIGEEFANFEANAAWELVNAPKTGTIVESKWVFKLKKKH